VHKQRTSRVQLPAPRGDGGGGGGGGEAGHRTVTTPVYMLQVSGWVRRGGVVEFGATKKKGGAHARARVFFCTVRTYACVHTCMQCEHKHARVLSLTHTCTHACVGLESRHHLVPLLPTRQDPAGESWRRGRRWGQRRGRGERPLASRAGGGRAAILLGGAVGYAQTGKV
jgi:hypothetical protein